MSLDYAALIDVIASHAMELGVFTQVNQHEPKNAPGQDISCAVWVDTIGPAESGLASTSVRLVVMARVYQNFILKPEDRIDPVVMGAVDALMTTLTADFTMGGLVRNLDLLGRGGIPLSAKAGYLQQDNQIFRTVDITIPMILNDVWEQVA